MFVDIIVLILFVEFFQLKLMQVWKIEKLLILIFCSICSEGDFCDQIFIIILVVIVENELKVNVN